MASIQRLKKELSYVTTELLFGCYVTEVTNPKIPSDDIIKVAQDVSALHSGTIVRINNYKRSKEEQKKSARKYFSEIRTDLVKSTSEIVERLESYKK
jgi:hypothetical protein